jgi:hypothetical protein
MEAVSRSNDLSLLTSVLQPPPRPWLNKYRLNPLISYASCFFSSHSHLYISAVLFSVSSSLPVSHFLSPDDSLFQRPIHSLRNRFPIPKTHSNHAILNCRSLVPSGCCHCRPCCYSSTPRWYVFLIHVQSDGGIKANTSFFRPDRPQRRLRPTSTSRGGCYDRCSRKRCSFRLCISQQGYVPSCLPPFLFFNIFLHVTNASQLLLKSNNDFAGRDAVEKDSKYRVEGKIVG